MSDLFSIHPTISFHVTVALGLIVPLSAAALRALLRRFRSRPRRKRVRSRWRIDYESPTGLAFRLSRNPRD